MTYNVYHWHDWAKKKASGMQPCGSHILVYGTWP